jgi:branched-chain amino acid transport system substrate-binding protein
MLYLNYAAIDPGLSNSDCGLYHFNFDANVNMKIAALVSYIKTQKDITKVFLINMDYSFGHAVSQSAREMLKRERPDIKIVGDVFTPIGQTKDYTPFIYKIRQSGAQASLLAKAAGQADLKGVRFFTFYAGIPGSPEAIGDAGAGRVMQVTPWVATINSSETKLATEFEAKYHKDWYYGSQVYVAGMLAKAINEAGTDDPTAVALHLEGMHYDTPLGDVYMRADNNAAVMPMYLSILEKGVKPSLLHVNMQWQMVKRIPAIDLMLPTSCQMERPKGAMLHNAYYNNTGK